jgi:hypothetical protein
VPQGQTKEVTMMMRKLTPSWRRYVAGVVARVAAVAEHRAKHAKKIVRRKFDRT